MLEIGLSIIAGIGLGVLGMLFFFVKPLQNQILQMRIMGFDPVKKQTQAFKPETFEVNET